jgi:HlyD family secretion protein
MRKSILIISLLFLILSCEDNNKYITPQKENLTVSVYATVIIEPKDKYNVFTVTPGIINEIFVNEGEKVQMGDSIALITSDKAGIERSNAELNYELAKSKYKSSYSDLDNLQNEIKSSQEKLSQDSLEYMRRSRLYKKSVGSKTAVEQAKLAYELSSNKHSSLLNNLKQLKAELRTNYKQSKNRLKKSVLDLDDFVIRAKIDGTIYSLNKEAGEIITTQEPIAMLGKTDEYIITMEVDEVDISKIELDQMVLISLDAYEGETFEGRISKIYPLKNQKTLSFIVEAEFTDMPSKLYAGLAGEANIVIEKINDVMTIPIEYLTESNTVNTKDSIVKVKVGNKNMRKVEIIEGLDYSTKITLPE